MGLRTSVPQNHLEATEWPVHDQNGYYQSYQENGRWVNWWARERHGVATFLARIWMEKDNSNIPDKEVLDETLPVKPPYWITPGSALKAESESAKSTWLGHATVLAEIDGVKVITDPIFSQRASAVQWVGPKRYRPASCQVSDLPWDLKAVVISHDHYDHLDYNSVNQINNRFGSQIYWFVPSGIGKWIKDNFNVNQSNIYEMVWWEEVEIPDSNGVKVACTPSNHWGRRGLLDEYKNLWASWAVIGPRNRFWFGGDTAYSDCFKQIGKKYGPFDIAAIPIGAYEPRWFMKFVHVNPEEAAQIHIDIQSKRSQGIHWGTFKLTYEFYLDPRSQIRALAQQKGIDFRVSDIGGTVVGP